MWQRLAQVLSEPVMGFLALAALVFGVTPELFDVDPEVHTLLAVGEWLVVVLFAVEYVVHFRLAESKRDYVLGPWRLLDLFIIVAPLVSLMPGTPEAMRSSPFLRVLRLVRAILAGTRASTRLRHRAADAARRAPQGPPVVTRLEPEGPPPAPLDWAQLLAWFEAPRGWLHAANLEPARLDELARATRVSRTLLELALHESSFPRLEAGVKWATLALPLPREDGGRDPILLLVGPQAVLSLSLDRSDLQASASPLPGATPAWPLRVVFGALRLALARHEDVAARAERELRALEGLPADESPGDFFEQTFALRKRLTASRADLWRLRGVLRALAEGRRELPGLGAGEREEAGRIAEEVDALHDTADGLRESLLSLLELHLNVSGYGMNRFMRLLAIVSALALIPAVVGGLMGMNLIDNPWPATLPQVAFGTFVLMLAVLYTFLAKGWLK